MHVTNFLDAPDKHEIPAVVVLFGDERFLKQSALHSLMERLVDDETGLTRFEGPETDLATVRDELFTVSMWGGRRLVLIEDADTFVTNHRSALENYVAKPAKHSILLLDVKTWPKTTRLAKAVAKTGLPLECSELKGSALKRWISQRAEHNYGKKIVDDAATLLVQLAGNEVGLLDQELAKLAAYVGQRDRIAAEDVQQIVGGWQTENTFAMTGALCDGKLGVAFGYLEKLLDAGESPHRILGGVGFVFRKFAAATEMARHGTPLRPALRKAGVYPKDVESAAAYLRRIGRPRGEKILQWLVASQQQLKGGSRLSERMVLEQLLIQLSGKV